jgi:hypothetical protein
LISFKDDEICGPGEYTVPNFYSVPTKDVLSSTSVLRNHGFSGYSKYSRGWKINDYDNYLEEIGKFNKYYNTIGTQSGASLGDRRGVGRIQFANDGWTYSSTTFSFLNGFVEPYEFVSNKQGQSILGSLEIRHNGNPLSFPYTFLDNTKITDSFKPLRYNYVSFDFIKKPLENGTSYLTLGNTENPLIDTDLLNLTDRPVTSIQLQTGTPITRIKEYFFNRRGLDLFLLVATSSTIIDNLKFVQTNSIPFIFLGTESRITQKVQVPLGSIAPPIDYSDSEFSLIDSLIITETAFDAITIPSVVITPSGFSSRPGRLDILNADIQQADSSFGVGLVSGGSSPFNPGQSTQYQNCRGSSGDVGNSN